MKFTIFTAAPADYDYGTTIDTLVRLSGPDGEILRVVTVESESSYTVGNTGYVQHQSPAGQQIERYRSGLYFSTFNAPQALRFLGVDARWEGRVE